MSDAMSYATVSYSTQDGFPSVVICSRDRIYRVASPVIARVVVRLIKELAGKIATG